MRRGGNVSKLKLCVRDDFSKRTFVSLAYFSDDERLAVLQSSFQCKPPRRASVQLDLDVVEGDELLHGLHAAPYRSFSVPAVNSPAAPVAVPPASPSPLWHQQRMDGGKTE